MFALLGCLDRSGFVYVTLIVDIEALESIGEAKDFILRELRELSKKSRGDKSAFDLVTRCSLIAIQDRVGRLLTFVA